MKKILLIAVAVFSLTVAKAQTEKGKMMIGGGFSIYGSKYDEYQPTTKRVNLSINPKFGCFISKNVMIGTELDLNYGHTNQYYSETAYNAPEKIISNSFGIGGGIFGRYYVRIIDNLRFFTNLGLNYEYTTTKEVSTYEGPNPLGIFHRPQFTHEHNASASLSPGLVYFMSPKIGLEASFGSLAFKYYTTKDDVPGSKRGSRIEGGFGIDISTLKLGLSYYF
jgi:hypothetical protein